MLPAFGWQTVLTQWEFAPVVTVAVAVAAALYVWGAVRVGRRHPARPWPGWRTAMFMGGLAVVVIATQSGIGAYDGVLEWDHMIQHLMLLMVAPPLLVTGQPVTLLLHASRNPLHTWTKRVMRSKTVAALTWPPVGLIAYVVMVTVTHLTSLADLTITNQSAHNAEHVLFLVVGYLFFLPLLGREPIRWRVSYPVRFVILALAMPVDTFTGLVLGYASTGLRAAGPRPPGSPSPVEDLHWAGAVMWIGGDAIMIALMMIVVLMWSRDDRVGALHGGWLERVRSTSFEDRLRATAGPGAATERVVASRGSMDDDDHLDAYNEYLARLHGGGPGGSG